MKAPDRDIYQLSIGKRNEGFKRKRLINVYDCLKGFDNFTNL